MSDLAKRFHDSYKKLAPQYGYETRFDTKQFNPDSPNGKLMIAVCKQIFEELKIRELGYIQSLRELEAQLHQANTRVEEPFQQRVQPWMMECFGEQISADTAERNHRFLEESLELVQACGCTASEAHQLVDYVYGREVGEKPQEAGGVMVTLAALCLAQGMDMHNCGEVELTRIWGKVDQIRAKQAGKPKNSPLPQAAERGE